MRRLVALGLAGLLGTGPVLGQGLADLAAKEKERRKKARAAAPAFTDEDLKKAGSGATPAASASPTPVATASSGGDAMAPGGEGFRWNQEAKGLRVDLAEAEKAVGEAQKKLEAAPSGVGQPQPSEGLRQLPVNPLIKEPAYEAAEKELADAKAAADVARAALAAFEEKARKAGVPPGWLR